MCLNQRRFCGQEVSYCQPNTTAFINHVAAVYFPCKGVCKTANLCASQAASLQANLSRLTWLKRQLFITCLLTAG